MGAARDIAFYRMVGRPNDTGDGVTGRSHSWLKDTGTYRTRTKNNGAGTERGSYLNDGETWCQICAVRPALGTVKVGRYLNWHDTPVTGYTWGSLSPVALDDDWTSDEGQQNDYLNLAYAAPCSGSGGTKSHVVPLTYGEWNWFFTEVLLSDDCNGAVTVWLQNATSSLADGPVQQLTNVRTLNNNASFFDGVEFWHGFYFSSGFTTGAGYSSGDRITVDQMLCMAGETWQEAWDDAPFLVTTTSSPLSVVTEFGAINTEDFPVPDDIASQLSDPPGGGGPPDPPPPATELPDLDRWFGRDSQGTIVATFGANGKRGNVFTPADRMVVDEAYVLLQGDAVSSEVVPARVGIYHYAGGAPGALIGQTEIASTPRNSTAAWVRFPVGTAFTLEGGEPVLPVLHTGAAGLQGFIDGTTGTFIYAADTFSDGLEDPFGTVDSADSRILSMIVNGHASAVVPPFRTGGIRPHTSLRTTTTTGGLV